MFEEVYKFVIEQLGKNDLIAGGAVLGVLAYVLNQVRTIPMTLLRWSRLAFVTHLDIPDRSDSFGWVSEWVAQHNYSKKSKRITLEVKKGKGVTTPAPGNHLVWWGRRPIILKRVRREGTGDNAHRAFRESWAVTMIGRRKHVEAFVEECRSVSQKDEDNSIFIRDAGEGYWNDPVRRSKRPLESVLCPPGSSENLLKDIREFIDSREWYDKMGIPWRRGYLLSGPPGNGKSSLVKAVASELNFEIRSLNLNKVTESNFSTLMYYLGETAILLLEDIDCAFDERGNKTSISMSSMLNTLDGVNASEGRIVFMTTNHPEKLDPALIRPGRVDLHIELPNPTRDQIDRLLIRFFNDSTLAYQLSEVLDGKGVSMAKLQGYLLQHRHSSQSAMIHIKDLIE